MVNMEWDIILTDTANIGWKTFVIFAVLNAAFFPMVYFFYPETKGVSGVPMRWSLRHADQLQIELEDIPLLFAKGGITGGVATSKGGRTVIRHQHADESHVDEKIMADHQEIERVA